jgi:hypothetical protein
MALNAHRTMNIHNKQPKKGGRNKETMEGRCNEQDMRGKRDSIILGAF